ncbi:Mo-dependent nitrogenase C-terminal domain-containing protein [Thermocoleostomius sinensis]|jgi:tellurite resistance protein|uniref:Nitrogenase n=1 Tax=Thermocoleostomius sinensis A174 TaxID=2016057 RepID=A0A9E8ZGR2_9CYAN|nr:Mo-dependent nitrogenase C-terminal domain-containing protein [Thermocoleostomius sinensis]WAL61482.1 nitrogenase [Thermocoleostomius sinensis A174]
MVSAVSPYTDEQIAVWLRGLLTVAWADGHFDPEEQTLIGELTQTELAPKTELGKVESITAKELARTLGGDQGLAENFMRTAVMVAIADGVYSSSEDDILHDFCVALDLPPKLLESLRLTLNYRPEDGGAPMSDFSQADQPDLLAPMREWLDHLEVHDPRLARFLCKMIPPQCPFERDVKLFGQKVVHIPPMCKLNPLYDQLVGLRFRALTYLADECQEDVTKYC